MPKLIFPFDRIIDLHLSVVLSVLILFSGEALSDANKIRELELIDANFAGSAYDKKTGELIYIEEHHMSNLHGENEYVEIMQSLYKNAADEEIGRRKIVFKDGIVTEYVLRQKPIKLSESVVRTKNSIEISVNDSEKITQKVIPIKANDEVVIDAGFSTFIVRNWDALINGETLKFKFVAISRLSVVDLQVRLTARADDSLEFTMTAANPIIKMLMKPIHIEYLTESKKLYYYNGMSNLQNQNNQHYNVEIKY